MPAPGLPKPDLRILDSNGVAADTTHVVEGSNRSTHSNRSTDVTAQDDRTQDADGTPARQVAGQNASDDQAPDTATQAAETNPNWVSMSNTI